MAGSGIVSPPGLPASKSQSVEIHCPCSGRAGLREGLSLELLAVRAYSARALASLVERKLLNMTGFEPASSSFSEGLALTKIVLLVVPLLKGGT